MQTLGLDREIDHHNGVLLHDPDQHDDPHERINVQLVVENQQRRQRAQARRGQAGENRDGVDETLIQNSEHQVDHQNGHHQQNAHPFQRRLERRGYPLEGCPNRGRQRLTRQLLHAVHRLAQ